MKTNIRIHDADINLRNLLVELELKQNQIVNSTSDTTKGSHERPLKEKVKDHKDWLISIQHNGQAIKGIFGNFQDQDLSNQEFVSCDLRGANFSNANLENAIFSESNLHFCDFTGAKIKNTIFENCKIDSNFLQLTEVENEN